MPTGRLSYISQACQTSPTVLRLEDGCKRRLAEIEHSAGMQCTTASRRIPLRVRAASLVPARPMQTFARGLLRNGLRPSICNRAAPLVRRRALAMPASAAAVAEAAPSTHMSALEVSSYQCAGNGNSYCLWNCSIASFRSCAEPRRLCGSSALRTGWEDRSVVCHTGTQVRQHLHE